MEPVRVESQETACELCALVGKLVSRGEKADYVYGAALHPGIEQSSQWIGGGGARFLTLGMEVHRHNQGRRLE